MLSSVISSALSGRVDSKFLIAYWLPAFVAVLGGIGILGARVGPQQLNEWVNDLDSVEQSLGGLGSDTSFRNGQCRPTCSPATCSTLQSLNARQGCSRCYRRGPQSATTWAFGLSLSGTDLSDSEGDVGRALLGDWRDR